MRQAFYLNTRWISFVTHFVVDIAVLLLSSIGGKTGRGNNDEKKTGWLVEVGGGPTIKEKVDIYLLTAADELVIVPQSCPMGILWWMMVWLLDTIDMAGRSVVVGVRQDLYAMFWPWSVLADTGLNHPTRDPAQDCGWVSPDLWCLSKSGDICLSERHFQLRSDDYDYFLRNVNGGQVQRKQQHPSPSLDEINPALHSVFWQKVIWGEAT